MSYCQFENTYKDLLQCLNAMNDDLSEDETAYKRRLVDVCKEIIDEYELNKMSNEEDGEWGFDIVELERGENDNDDIPWDTQTR